MGEKVTIMIVFFLMSFTITSQYIFLEVYVLELYPTQIRLIGDSFAQIIGGIAIAFVDFIIDGCEDSGFSVMIVFCIFAALSMVVSSRLPETFGKTPPDFIKELEPHHIHISIGKGQSESNVRTKGETEIES